MEKPSNESASVYPSKKILGILLGGVIILLFLAIFLFTRNSVISAFDLTNKGTIGDAINGITGPIIALISAGLLFYSFQAQLESNKRQLEANRAIKSQWEFDTYYKLYGEIEKAFKQNLVITITSRETNNGKTDETKKDYRAVAYIVYITKRIPRAKDEEVLRYLSRIDPIIEDIIVLINYVRESDVSQKHFFLHRINRLYTTSLEEYLNELYQLLHNKPQFQQSYDLNELFKQKIESIRKNELKNNILS